jgi:hypothetical protein
LAELKEAEQEAEECEEDGDEYDIELVPNLKASIKRVRSRQNVDGMD